MILFFYLLFQLVEPYFLSSHYMVKAVSIYTYYRTLCNESFRVNLVYDVKNKARFALFSDAIDNLYIFLRVETTSIKR